MRKYLASLLTVFITTPAYAQQPDTAEAEPSLPEVFVAEEDPNDVSLPEFFVAEEESIMPLESEAESDTEGNYEIEEDDGLVELTEDEEHSDITLPDPLYTIESIQITGNTATSAERICSVMGIREGDRLQLRALELARVNLVTRAAIDDAELELKPGSSAGKIRIIIRVAERLPLQINDYYIGLSKKSDFWLGLNVSYNNLFSTGHRLDMIFAAASAGEYTWLTNYSIPHIAGSAFSLSFGVHSSQTFEYLYDKAPALDNGDLPSPSKDLNLGSEILGLSRHGFHVIANYQPLPEFSVRFGVRSELNIRDDDKLHENTLKSDHAYEIDHLVKKDHSHSTLGIASFTFSNQEHSRVPTHGHVAGVAFSGTVESSASDYQFFRALLFHQSNWSITPEHILRLFTRAGVIVGDAPYYERFHFSDYYDYLPNRIGSFNPSNAQAFDLFKTGTDDLSYEDYMVNLSFEYAWHQAFRRAHISNIEFYVRLNGIYMDSFDESLIVLGSKPGKEPRSAFPIDGSADIGVRIETAYGFFKVSLGYVLNLIPR